MEIKLKQANERYLGKKISIHGNTATVTNVDIDYGDDDCTDRVALDLDNGDYVYANNPYVIILK